MTRLQADQVISAIGVGGYLARRAGSEILDRDGNAAYAPALEPAERRGLFRLKLGWLSGLLLGGTFFWIVRTFYIAAPSPFLYFNF